MQRTLKNMAALALIGLCMWVLLSSPGNAHSNSVLKLVSIKDSERPVELEKADNHRKHFTILKRESLVKPNGKSSTAIKETFWAYGPYETVESSKDHWERTRERASALGYYLLYHHQVFFSDNQSEETGER